MKINKHGNLVNTEQAGNGYHGNCEYCGLPCVTDLGYFSFNGTTCIDREITSESDVPEEIRSYARFHGMKYKIIKAKEIIKIVKGKAKRKVIGKDKLVYVKPYDRDYTLKELDSKIKKIKKLWNNI